MKEKTEWVDEPEPTDEYWLYEGEAYYYSRADLRWINFGNRDVWWSSGLNKDGKILGDQDERKD